MIDTTGKCTACGQTVGIDTIHTCSPQVTAPTQGLSPAERRVGEARLSAEWVRVISEDGAVLGSWLAEGGTKLRSEVVESEAAKFLALDLLDARAAVARLTAEVERLTSEAGELRALVKYAAQHVDERETMHAIRDRLAALSLPTPGANGAPPEATE
jgi:hypothetical protein